jgi:osmotically-inducible protein OsmY
MKMKKLFYIAPTILIAAGCAEHERQHSQARFDDSLYPGYAHSASGSGGASSSTRNGAQATGGSDSTSATLYSSDIFSTNPADNSLVSEIRQSIQKDQSLASVAPKIQIGANSGTVTLMGNVESDQQKQSLESLVRQSSGVTTVDNKIEVASETASTGMETGSDTLSATSRTNDVSGQRSTEIAGAQSGVANAVGSDRIYHEAGDAESGSTNNLSATSREDSSSSIYSTGQSGSNSNQVDSTSEQLRATSTRGDQSSATYNSDTNSAAGQTGGINVKVQGSSQSDRTLAQQVSQELRTDASLASALSQVSISVNDGKVTLQGSVKNAEQKSQIESSIQRITGVSSVDNQLQVGTDQSTPRNQ